MIPQDKTPPGLAPLFFAPPEPPNIPDHELLRRIGRGSYGEVWLARNITGAFRAVKIVYRASFEDVRPFEREFSGISNFEPISRSHEGLVDILQVGRNGGFFYCVMELADDLNSVPVPELVSGERSESSKGKHPFDPGLYVARTLASQRARCGRLDPSECVRLGHLLASALDYLHQNGLLHRDIKPSNIVFVGGVPKLADIGLVAEFEEAHSYVGTEGFIPPEGPNSPQADVYSLGKVLYEVAMGKDRHDFPEPYTEIEQSPEQDVLVELNAVILKACEPDRHRRYKSAKEMCDELLLVQRGESIRQKRARERRLKVMLISAATVMALSAGVFGVDRWLQSRMGSMQGQSSLLHPSLVNKVAPRDNSLPAELIDLSSAYTAPLIERWYPGPPDNTLASLPRGPQTLAGTRFDVRGLVQLAGGEISSYGADLYPARVRDIWIERWVQRLHFLHGAVSEVSDGKVIGAYRIYYNTARSLDVPVVFGRNVRALWQPRHSDGVLTNAIVAWRGQNPATQSRDLELRLYKFTWENPWPHEEVVAVDFTSTLANAAPFLVALTADDAPLRPDQKHGSVNLVKAMQEAAHSFPQLPTQTGTQPFVWSPLKLYTQPVELGGRYYDGFRFTTPEPQSMDLVWTFSPERAPVQGWFILPMNGGLKVGFEDWYHASPGKKADGSKSEDFVVQFLSGKKLQPGREYFIWFGSDTNKPIDLQTALRFTAPGRVDPNKAGELVRALEMPMNGEASYHRHFCLGAIH